MATLRALLQQPVLGAKLVYSGDLDAQVTWIASELFDERSGRVFAATEADLTPGCLVVATFESVLNHGNWRNTIASLRRRGVAALGVLGALNETELPHALLTEASTHQLTLFVTASGVHVDRCARLLFELHRSDELRAGREALLAQRRILDTAFSGTGAAGIVSVVAALTQRPVALTDETGEALAQTAHQLADEQAGREAHTLDIGAGRQLVIYGEDLDAEGISVVTAAATVLSVEHRLETQNTVTERERWGRLTRAILTDGSHLRSLANLLDTSVSLPDRVRVVAVQGPAETVARWRSELRTGVDRLITRYPIGIPAEETLHSGLTLAWQIVPADCETPLQRALTSLRRHGLDAVVGLEATLATASLSRRSAEMHLERLSQTSQLYASPRSPVVFFAEETAPLIDLVRSFGGAVTTMVLGPLSVANEASETSELRTTLEVILRHHGQRGPAAAELGIHRNTLRHRIQHIEQLTNRSLDRADDRAEMWIALQAESVMASICPSRMME